MGDTAIMVASGNGKGMEAGYACGSRILWVAVSVTTEIIGWVLIIVACAVGGCSCAGECPYDNSDSCISYFGGCDKGDYDSNRCAQQYINTPGTTACSEDYCKTGGMSAGGMFAIMFLGILFTIIGCVFACGCCPILCFKGPPDNVGAYVGTVHGHDDCCDDDNKASV